MCSDNSVQHGGLSYTRHGSVVTTRLMRVRAFQFESVPVPAAAVMNILPCLVYCLVAAQTAQAQTVTDFKNTRSFLWEYRVEPCLPPGIPGRKCEAARPQITQKRHYFLFDQRDGQYLLVPSILVSGIEANNQDQTKCAHPPTLCTLPNYFSESFSWANYFYGIPARPPSNEILVGINSANVRTEDQLHIHICRILPDTKNKLGNAQVGNSWTGKPYINLGTQMKPRMFDARRIGSLSNVNPFALLFDDPGATDRTRQMADQIIVVTGAPTGTAAGYYVLNGRNDGPSGAWQSGSVDEHCVKK